MPLNVIATRQTLSELEEELSLLGALRDSTATAQALGGQLGWDARLAAQRLVALEQGGLVVHHGYGADALWQVTSGGQSYLRTL
jgi:hypothetical protein